MRVYGMNVLKVFTSRKEVCKYCSENKIKYELVDNHLLNKMCVYNHQGVVIDAFDYDYYTLKDIEGDLVLILDHLEDPHNFGAIIRTCASVGIKSIIIPKDRSVGVTDVVVKTSVGTINYVKIIMVNNLVATIKTLQKDGFFVYAASMEGTDFRKVDYSNKVALVIGNEGSGVSRLVKESSDCLISIPMNKNVESLNASVAASILIYHLGMHE